VQAVVIPGEKTHEGRLIQDVTIAWVELVRLMKQDPDLIFKIDARTWEEIVAGAYKRAGYEEVTLTPRSGDFGRGRAAAARSNGDSASPPPQRTLADC
jgi:restriction system protein